MKCKLKARGTKRLKYDEPPSNFAFNSNLRRCAKVVFPHQQHISKAGKGILRIITRPILNLLLLLRASVWALTLRLTYAPISVEWSFCRTLLQGGLPGERALRRHPHL
jgi:hypothetical protein